MIALKRIAITLVIAFIVVVFGLFAYNFYRRATMGDDPTRPPVIFEKTDRPSRA